MSGPARAGVPSWQAEVRQLMRTRAFAAALERLRQLAPSPAVSVLQAQCLVGLERPREACRLAESVLRHDSLDVAALDALGGLLSQSGAAALALQAFDRALALAPDHPHLLFNRATVYRFVGRFADAERDYDRVIAQRPLDCEAYLNRSELRRQTPAHHHVAELQALLERGFADALGEVRLRYALAKEYEDLGEYAASFREVQLAARARRAQLRYDIGVDLATVEWLCEAFASLPPRPDPPAGNPGPVFIVGLPRSGSTLVERILGCHSAMTAGGELKTFALCLMEAIRSAAGGKPVARREAVQRSRDLDFAALGAAYLARARQVLGAERRFTDKMPLNYLYCGLIRRAVPGARIVHVQRHPMASCYAMYKTLFNAGYPFSYDLDELGQYYLGYRRLMSHWDAVMPGEILTLRYESLVADPERQIRRLLSFCGLPWEQTCLAFHLNDAPTMTASAVQVRQPLYHSAVALWRHLEGPLTPLSARFKAAQLDLESE